MKDDIKDVIKGVKETAIKSQGLKGERIDKPVIDEIRDAIKGTAI